MQSVVPRDRHWEPTLSVRPHRSTVRVSWRDDSRSFATIGMYTWNALAFAGEGEPERVEAATVTANLFPLLGVTPMLGRGFLPEEKHTGTNRVIILGNDLWRRRFGGDRTIIGRLAPCDLSRVRTPALLVVGGADQDTLRLNRDSVRRLAGPVALKTVPGAGHTFEESGALGRVGELVVGWLTRQRRMERVRALTRFLTPSRERTVGQTLSIYW